MSIQAEFTHAATGALELAINQYLQLDPHMAQQMSRFNGKVIAIDLQGLALRLFCLPAQDGMHLLLNYQGQYDTLITGRPLALLQMALREDSSTLMFAGDIRIEGDIELGQSFKQALNQLDIDWEEHLSHLCGDVLAHKIGHFTREIQHWWRNSTWRFSENSAEYLQQEIFATPTRGEVDTFYQNVEQLRDDSARLMARIQRLQKTLQNKAE